MIYQYYINMEPLVATTRSNRIENITAGYICISDPHRNIVYHIGDPDTKIYMRSSAKPIQAVAFVNSGAMQAYGINLRELAVICSSHNGEADHRETVKSILQKIGLDEEYLKCGAAYPYSLDMKDELIRKRQRPTQLHNCCSGKHSGMLALCRFYCYPTENYYEPQHPVQQLILGIFAELLESRPDNIVMGMDGCGVPNFMVALHDASYLYSLLAEGSEGSNRYKESFGLIQKAMMSFPMMINGTKEFCTELIMYSEGKVIGKIGANGVYCVAVPEKRLGMCIKVSDGNAQRSYPVVMRALKNLGVLSRQAEENLKRWSCPEITNHRGEIIGHTIPIFDLNKRQQGVRIGDEFLFGIK